MKNKYSLDMTTGPLLKKIFIFSVPLMLSGLLQLAYNTADVVVVGRFAGSEALAAVGSTGSLINLLLNVFLGLSMGSGVTVARHIGANDFKRTHDCTHTAMLLSLISGIIICIIGFFAAGRLLVLMKAPAEVLPLATLYLKIYFIGAPGSMVYNFGASLLRASGDTKRPLYILFFSGLVNVGLNLLLVICFSMGVSGVAIGTIASQYISAVMVVICLCGMNNGTRLSFGDLAIHPAELKRILLIGLPAGIQNSLFSISNVIIQSTVNTFGATAMAGIAAGSNYDGYIYTCTNAVGQAAMNFSSQNIGAKKYENINKIYARCILVALIIGCTLSGIGIVLREPIIGLFSKDAAVIKIGAERMLLVMPFYVFCSLMDVAAAQLRGMGRSVEPMIVSLLGGCGIRLLWIFFALPHNMTLNFLYWSYPISWTITFFIQFAMFFILRADMKRKGQFG